MGTNLTPTNDIKTILGFHMTSRPPCWCPKQRKGGHVGAPTKSSGNLTLLLCKRFLLFSLKNMAVDHVSENQQFPFTLFYSVNDWYKELVFNEAKYNLGKVKTKPMQRFLL